MNDDELITAVREPHRCPFGHLGGADVQRGRAVRARRSFRRGRRAGRGRRGGACRERADTGQPPARHPLAAWTVVKQADGKVSVTIRQFRDPAGLQRKLRADGVPASVIFNPRLRAGTVPRALPRPEQSVSCLQRRARQAAEGGGRRAPVRRAPGGIHGLGHPSWGLGPAVLASSSSPLPTPVTWTAARSASRSGSSWCKPASGAPVAEPTRPVASVTAAGAPSESAGWRRACPSAPQAASTARLLPA